MDDFCSIGSLLRVSFNAMSANGRAFGLLKSSDYYHKQFCFGTDVGRESRGQLANKVHLENYMYVCGVCVCVFENNLNDVTYANQLMLYAAACR